MQLLKTIRIRADKAPARGNVGSRSQSSGTFTTAGLAGKYFYSTEDPSDNTIQDETGVLTVATTGAFAGTSDQSGSSGLKAAGSAGGTISITDSSGTGNVGTDTIAITNGTKLFFMNESVGESPVIFTAEKQ
jgi:hypothetical protein